MSPVMGTTGALGALGTARVGAQWVTSRGRNIGSTWTEARAGAISFVKRNDIVESIEITSPLRLGTSRAPDSSLLRRHDGSIKALAVIGGAGVEKRSAGVRGDEVRERDPVEQVAGNIDAMIQVGQ